MRTSQNGHIKDARSKMGEKGPGVRNRHEESVKHGTRAHPISRLTGRNYGTAVHRRAVNIQLFPSAPGSLPDPSELLRGVTSCQPCVRRGFPSQSPSLRL